VQQRVASSADYLGIPYHTVVQAVLTPRAA
jgi:hypothetical protein